MKLSKEFIKGYIYCAIKLSNFDTDLNVRATVYFIELSGNFEVELNWNTGYDNAKNEEVDDFSTFLIDDDPKSFEIFHKLFIKQLDEISKITYDSDYDSRQAEIEFREEMKFESNRGN